MSLCTATNTTAVANPNPTCRRQRLNRSARKNNSAMPARINSMAISGCVATWPECIKLLSASSSTFQPHSTKAPDPTLANPAKRESQPIR